MKPEHNYFAFLSHRGSDKDFARELQRKLERYRIPSAIRKSESIEAKHVKNVCLDATSFASNVLTKEIQDKLDSSDKMILLCSRASANPIKGRRDWSADPSAVEDWSAEPRETGWVGMEIDYMLKSSRVEDIIPIVIDGDPSAGDCFHPLILQRLRHGDITWFDFRKESHPGRTQFLKVVASILEIDNLEAFIKRDAALRRRNKALLALLIAFFVALAGLAYYWFAPHSSAYADYTLRNGVPEGITELSSAECATRTSHYVITTTNFQHSIRLEHVNSLETPIAEETPGHDDGPMIAVFKCRDNWQPDTVEYLDRNGIPQITYAYATDMQYVQFQENEYVSNQVFPVAGTNDFGTPNHLKIDRYALSYDEDGLLKQRMYMSGVNYVVDENGVAGEQFEYDESGRIIAIRYLDSNRKPSTDQKGIAGKNVSYGDDGKEIRLEFVDPDGNLTYGPDRFAYSVDVYNEGGALVRQEYHGTDGALTTNSDGFALATLENDNGGKTIIARYFGPDESPIYNSEGCHAVHYDYNDRGDAVSISYYDENDNPTINKDGVGTLKKEYDGNGNVLKTSYFDASGDAMFGPENAAVVEQKINDSGYVVEESNYGIDGHPVIAAGNYSRKVMALDSEGKPTSVSYYGPDGQPFYAEDGYHELKLEYDDMGNMVRASKLDASGKPIAYQGLWATQEVSYNGGGYVTEVAYYDKLGKPFKVSDRYASLANEYDEQGHLLSTSYFDERGKPSVGGMMGTSIGVDNFARIHRFSSVRFEYDERGNPVKMAFFDTNGNPLETGEYTLKREAAIVDSPFASRESIYDEVGRVVEQRFFDGNGHPADDIGCIVYEYDERGNKKSVEIFAGDGAPAEITNNESVSLSGETWAYDQRGNVSELRLLERAGSLKYSVASTYDVDNNKIERTFQDDAGKPVSINGRASERMTYDSRARLVEKTTYDVGGNPVSGSEGYATERLSYNDDWPWSASDWSYYDADGNRASTSRGISRISIRRSDSGRNVDVVYLNSKDEQIIRYSLERNADYEKTGESLYGPDDRLLSSPSYGIARQEYEFDKSGNLTTTRYYDEAGHLHSLLGICAAWEREFEKGEETKRTYYGEDGRPSSTDKGYAIARSEYDDDGRMVKRSFFDDSDRPVNTVFGFCSYSITYDGDGDLSNVVYYDVDGGKLDNVQGEVSVVLVTVGMDASTQVSFDSPTDGYVTKTTNAGTAYQKHTVFMDKDGEMDITPRVAYYPMYPNETDFDQYLRAALNRYSPSTDSANIALSDYPDSKYWAEVLDTFVESVEQPDAGKLMQSLGIDEKDASGTLSVVTAMAASTGGNASKGEVLDYYQSFYASELQKLHAELDDEFGAGWSLSYDIVGVEAAKPETIEALNSYYAKMGAKDIAVASQYDLAVKFTVEAEGSSEIASSGLLSSSVSMFEQNGVWYRGTTGWPSPNKDDLMKLFGLGT